MSEIKNILLLFIILTLLLSCNNSNDKNCTPVSDPDNPCTPNSNSSDLLMTVIPQEVELWCWAACGEMVMEKLGNAITQCDQANMRFGRTDCCESPTSDDCNRGGWPQFNMYEFKADSTLDAALSWEDVQHQIDCQKTPFCATWKWDEGGGHMMVISAYKIEDGEKWVMLDDPYPVNAGLSSWIRHSEYVSGPGYSHWNDFFNIRKCR